VRDPEKSSRDRSALYQVTVLGVSAIVIVGAWLLATSLFQSAISRTGGVSLGLQALGQVVGAAAPHGPAANELPGLVGTPTPAVAASETPLVVVTPSATSLPDATSTPTPDTRFYDPARAKTLLAQAQTSFGTQPQEFVANVTLAAQRLNGQRIAPGVTLSFDSLTGPYTSDHGYRTVSAVAGGADSGVPTIEGGITQVSTTLFQAAFWSGLKIVERHTHPYWLDRWNAGSTAQRGLDAYVAYPSDDLRIQNTTGDWVRVEASIQSGSVSVSIYGVDPGWSVNPDVGSPASVVQPHPTQTVRTDPSVPPGQQFILFRGSEGFDVVVQRTVTRQNQTVDRYGLVEHYQAMPAILVVGAQPTPTLTPPTPPEPTEVVINGEGPTHLDGLDPGAFVLPDGRIRTPNLVSLTEDEAQRVINAVGFQTSYANDQGPGDVPASILDSVPVGHVLSQNPAPGSPQPRGTTIYIAVRKG